MGRALFTTTLVVALLALRISDGYALNEVSTTTRTSTPDFAFYKMDTDTNPGENFYRFAAGHWLDAVELSSNELRISSFNLLHQRINQQLHELLEQAAQQSATATLSSPLQQVGDFFVSGMDVTRLEALGIAPLQPAFERIETIVSPETLARTIAHFGLRSRKTFLFRATVSTDYLDRSRYAIYAVASELGMPAVENYLNQEDAPLREAYQAYLAANLELAGSPAGEAQTQASTILAIETRIAAKKLTEGESGNPDRLYTRISLAELQSQLPNLDPSSYFAMLELPTARDTEIIVLDIAALREWNQILEEYPLEAVQTYLHWLVLKYTKAYLTPAFNAPALAWQQAQYGNIDMPEREELVIATTSRLFGHPLSRLYVESYFSQQSHQQIEDIVERLTTLFRARLQTYTWMSDTTREQALEKIDRLVVEVGYPQHWIDYSSVAIHRGDYLGNFLRVNEFFARRDLARLGNPVSHDDFAQPGTSLPIDINASYVASRNKIEVSAAMLQTPFFDPDADVAVNYCTIGAVIGHEITHGYDSGGRRYDAMGNVRDWWTEQDTAYFNTQVEKLIAQADAFEVLPGLNLNGELTMGENLADVGGIALAYQALQNYLREHPEADRRIHGYTPQQRCFIAWAQLWSEKTNPAVLRQLALTGAHAPGAYRSTAPLVHQASFFEAFDIIPGDPLWRDQQDRVSFR